MAKQKKIDLGHMTEEEKMKYEIAGELPGIDGTDGQSALPEIENMEGAAFFAVCEALGVACCQIRAVSNYVGEPFDRWAGGLAVENLTATLTQIFGNDE